MSGVRPGSQLRQRDLALAVPQTARVHWVGLGGRGWESGSCSLSAWPKVRRQMEGGGFLFAGGQTWIEGSLWRS